MARRGRTAHVLKLVFWAALSVGGLIWTVFALQRVKLEDADTAGVLTVLPGALGAAFGAWGVLVGIKGLRAQRTPEVIAAELAQLVLRAEGRQYRQLLASGQEAPHGRIDVAFTAASPDVSGSATTGSLESVAPYYRQLKPGRLVITGTPSPPANTSSSSDAGAGKTVLALALLLDLVRERSAGEPVPIRLTASSWPGGEIRTWLTEQLIHSYGLNRRDALQVVEADLVFPVIDGLDEMDKRNEVGYTSRASNLVRAVERFESGGLHRPVVITSRREHYDELISLDTQPRRVAHLTILPVDAARAHKYLLDRIANTPVSLQRWRPILTALEEAASPSGTHRLDCIALSRALDTPWRLTLAITVFQERTPDGSYARNPSDLLTLAASGRLYEFLLDRFVGATISAHQIGEPDRIGTRKSGPIRHLEAQYTWKYLATLARYLNSNATGTGGSPRIIDGRPLSSTDIIPHELWPAAGLRLPRWVERFLIGSLATATAVIGWRYSAARIEMPFEIYLSITVLAVLVFTFVLAGQAWPSPQHVDLRWFRSPAYRRQLLRDIAITFTVALLVSSLFGIYQLYTGKNLREAVTGATALGVTLGLINSLSETLREKILSTHSRAVTNPREIIREDSAILSFYILGSSVVAGVITVTQDGPLVWVPGIMIGGFLLAFLLKSGRASVRYWIFLAYTRRKLPLRLCRFLDAAYQVGILRVSGTAWQFRHRELQDHLAIRPSHPII
ncbi:hypothetical protein [Streptomyces sp. NPDC126499]|uniref:hypothetical protein n=1 Tax=Streptomyces sp. NPDC126499 TaxID=3155314 RepID=UPI0033288895